MTDQIYHNIAGRLVQGDVFTPQDKDMQGRPMTDMRGNPKVQYFMGVAVAKNAPDFAPAWQAIQAEAVRSFPNGETQNTDFAWKVIDGDLPQHAGKEGFPGHYVFRFTSGFPFKATAQGASRPIVDPSEIKRGYYVRVYFTVKGNGNAQKPGVYLNGSVVELLGFGPEITSGPDAASIVQTAGATYVPAGAQSTPVSQPGQAPAAQPAPGGMPGQAPAAQPAPGGMPNQTFPGAPTDPAMQPPGAPAPAPGGMPGQAPAPGIQPHPGILNPGQGQ